MTYNQEERLVKALEKIAECLAMLMRDQQMQREQSNMKY